MSHAPTHDAALERLAMARRLDARLRLLARRSGRAEAHIALLLSVMDRDRHYRSLGYKNANAYARAVADWSSTKTSRMITLVRDLQTLPEMSRLFYKGEIPWTKACIAAAEAAKDPGTDAEWCERVRRESRDSLERRARAAAGLPMLHDLYAQLDDEQQAWLDDAFVTIQRERGETVNVAVVIGEACRRLAQGGVVGAGPRPLVAIGICAKCDEATHGTVTRPADQEPAICNGELIDLTKNPPTKRPAIRPRTAAQVLGRDQGRCRVPSCGNATWLDLHHEGGWRNVGDDPEKIVTLCGSHHDALHKGALKIIFDSGRVTFTLADGEIVGETDLRVLPGASHGRSGGYARPVAPAQRKTQENGGAPKVGAAAPVSATSVSISDAQEALVALGVGAREAATLVASAGPCETTELLVMEALRRRPVPA